MLWVLLAYLAVLSVSVGQQDTIELISMVEKVSSTVWTIVIGIIVGVSANLLTPQISKLRGKLFIYVKKNNERKEEVFENSVRSILDKPNDEIVLRIEKNGYYSRSLIIISISLLLANLFPSSLSLSLLSIFSNPLSFLFGLLTMAGSLLSFYIGFYYWVRARKLSRIVNEVWCRRREMQHSIKLDL